MNKLKPNNIALRDNINFINNDVENRVTPSLCARISHDYISQTILVPIAHDPSDLRQGSRALTEPDFLSMRRVFVSCSQPIRFARFDGKFVNRGLPVLDQARRPEL